MHTCLSALLLPLAPAPAPATAPAPASACIPVCLPLLLGWTDSFAEFSDMSIMHCFADSGDHYSRSGPSMQRSSYEEPAVGLGHCWLC